LAAGQNLKQEEISMYRIARASLFASLLAALAPAGAQSNYPNKPIRMVVPFAPGGGSDISGRVLAAGLSEALGQTIVVDNRPGAGSILGCDIVAKSISDGYTTLLGNISMAFNTAIYKKLPYDVMRDFAPITLVTDQPNILVAHPGLPSKSFKEFLAYAESNPGKLTFGSAGMGSGTHLAMEMLLMSRKLQLTHVPYKGTGPALTALLGNQISVFFSTYASALPHVKGNRLRGYAVTSVKRTTTLPQVPTVAIPRLRIQHLVRLAGARRNAARDYRQAQPRGGRRAEVRGNAPALYLPGRRADPLHFREIRGAPQIGGPEVDQGGAGSEDSAAVAAAPAVSGGRKGQTPAGPR
jgi:tripartite-type tricarboxylate transporter receptor subunit TctC